MDDSWAVCVAETALESTVTATRRPPGGGVAETVVLELAGSPGVAVCKRGGASIWTGTVIEPAVLRLVRDRTDLPVPKVLASGWIHASGRWTRWGLYEYRTGDTPTLEDRSTRLHLAVEAGALLGKLHAAVPLDHRGGIDRVKGDLVIRPDLGVGALEWPLAGHRDGSRVVLDHGDFRPGNVLLEDGSIGTVLDWGNAHATTAAFGLARAEARFADAVGEDADERRRLRKAFRRGYRQYVDVPAAATIRRLKLLWLAQAAWNVLEVATTRSGRRTLARVLAAPTRRAGS